MRFTKSGDGIERVSIQVIIRCDRDEIAMIRQHLKDRSQPHDDTAIKEFVRSLTEYIPFDSIASETTEY